MRSIARSTPVAAAVLGIVVVPALLGEVTITQPITSGAPVAEEEAPKPAEAKLAVALTTEEKTGDSEAHLLIKTAGPPPSGQAKLTSAGGVNPVTVTDGDSAACKGLVPRQALSDGADQEWCLKLDGIDDGTETSGTIASAGTVLELTVTRREAFVDRAFPWIFTGPFLWTMVGLVVGFLMIVVPASLRRSARAELLNEALDRNDQVGADAQIEGLRSWVDARKAEGDEPDSLVVLITRVMRDGPSKARAARLDLGTALQDSSLPDDHRFVAKAREVAEKQGHDVGDFLKHDGTKQGEHPAQAWLTALKTLEGQGQELNRLRKAIDDLPEPHPAGLQAKLTTAEAAFKAVDDNDEAEGLGAAIKAIDEAVEAAKLQAVSPKVHVEEGRPPMGKRSRRGEVRRRMDRLRRGESGAVPGVDRLGDAATWVWNQRLRVLTAAVIFVIVAWAVLAVEQTLYEPKPAFGSTEDYLALITGAIGSAAAGAVLGLLAIWDPSKETEGE